MGCSKKRIDSGSKTLSGRGEAARVEFIKKHGDYHRIIDRIGVWTPGQVKDFVVFYKFIKDLDISLDDVQDWIKVTDENELGEMDEKQEEINIFLEFQNQRFACPECGYYLTYMPVNTTPRTMVGGSYKFLINCGNHIEGCEWEHYTRLSLDQWVRKEKKARALALRGLRKEIIRKAQEVLPVTAVRKDALAEAEERVGKIIRKRKKEKEENAKTR